MKVVDRWNARLRQMLLPLVAAGLAACGGGSEPGDSGIVAMAASAPAEAVAPGRGETLRQRSGTSPAARALVLADPAREQPAAQAAAAPGRPTPRRIGFARHVPGTADAAATAAQLQWQTLPDGRHVAALSLTSPQAQGLRLGLLVRKLPAAATLRFYAQGAAMAQEIAAVDVLDVLQHNRASGETGDAADTYWSPLVEGSEATLEIELPARVAPGEVALALPQLSHLNLLPTSAHAVAGTVQPKIGEAASCQIDVSCNAEYQNESNAVARLLFVRGGDSYVCSGTLLADKGASGTPYLLTANHCIAGQAVASSLQTFWFYRSPSCNAGVLGAQSRTSTGGAALLYASDATDTSFMRLNNRPPAGVFHAAWSADPLPIAEPVFGLHHPRGDLQKVSVGTLASYERCTTQANDLSCLTADVATSQFVNVHFSSGSSEPGSSGSPLFRRVNGISYVTGQLYGGSASCQDRSGTNVYGRLDLAHAAALQRWLDGPAALAPIYRFFNTRTGAHFYTIDAAERDYVVATYAEFVYEGPSFHAYGLQAEGTSPVYRFFNVKTGAHFFTIDQAERDYVRVSYPEYLYEGVGWYARTAQQAGTTALYRFYNLERGTHFYTPSASERDYVRQTWPVFLDEGVGYYVWPGL